MRNLLTKKAILSTSLIGTALFILFMLSSKIGLCDKYDYSCVNFYDSISELFQIFVPTLLISFLALVFQEEVFQFWLKFAQWWILLMILLVLLAPSSDLSLLSLEKTTVSIVMDGIFLVVSLILIINKASSFRGKKV